MFYGTFIVVALLLMCHHGLTGFPIRLIGGSSYNEGRVEIYYNYQWGTICDGGWDDIDAGVVCRQLGFGSLGTAIVSAGFGRGTGSILLDSVSCTGNELTLASCAHLGLGVTRSCGHHEDAGVRCSIARHLIRLVGGSSYNEGRVEVNYNGEWGTVCDYGWDDADAGVVCRQLGFGSSGTAIRSAEFGQGSGSIWLDSVSCTGNESTLTSCGHLGVNITRSCNHSADAGVRCTGGQGIAVRLVGGSSNNRGKVEVNYNGEWSTVCDDGWDNTDASVVCRQLGFGLSGATIGFGQHSKHIFLNDVTCTGTEATLARCAHTGMNITATCNSSVAAGVICYELQEFKIRLVGGSSCNEGRVEVNYNSEWGTVCDDGWDDTDAGVVCRQLGFGSSGTTIESTGFGQGSGSIWLDSVTCTGNESTLASCGHLGVGVTSYCDHFNDASVICTGDYKFLVNVEQLHGLPQGKVEIFINGQWGLVCADGWDTYDASVVCQETDLGTNGTPTQLSYGRAETIWLSGVGCIGNESQLSFCPHNGLGIVDNCTFVAGVKCNVISNSTLMDESSSSSPPGPAIGGTITTFVVISLLVFVVIVVIVVWKKRQARTNKPEKLAPAETSSSVPNPMYGGNIDTNEDFTSPECEEHIYDVIDTCDINEKQEMDPEQKKSFSLDPNFTSSANNSADSASIKSDDTQHEKSRVDCMSSPTSENAANHNNPTIVRKRPAVKPVAKAHPYLPTRKNLPTKEEYALSDVKITTKNQYASLGERQRGEDQYASLYQDTSYQQLVGQQSRPSQYAIPRTTN